MSDDDLCVRCDSPIRAGDRFARIPNPNVLNDDAEIVVHEACLQLGRKDHIGFTPDDGHAGRFNEDADGEWQWDDDNSPIRPGDDADADERPATYYAREKAQLEVAAEELDRDVDTEPRDDL